MDLGDDLATEHEARYLQKVLPATHRRTENTAVVLVDLADADVRCITGGRAGDGHSPAHRQAADRPPPRWCADRVVYKINAFAVGPLQNLTKPVSTRVEHSGGTECERPIALGWAARGTEDGRPGPDR